MIKIKNVDVFGFESAIRGMRNPFNSWDKSDSYMGFDCTSCGEIDRKGYCKPKEHDCSAFKGYQIGENDFDLMMKLIRAGSDHSKFMRMINVTLDIIAPLYWWKEFDTYKISTIRNSCSTMHTIHSKGFTLDDFSHEHLVDKDGYRDKITGSCAIAWFETCLLGTIDHLNFAREKYLETKDKFWWWQMIQLLPSSYNQRATVQLNYAVLRNMYHARKNHKLKEWVDFCKWIETLPYSELITM